MRLMREARIKILVTIGQAVIREKSGRFAIEGPLWEV